MKEEKNILEKMERVYFFKDNLYLKITEKNDEFLKWNSNIIIFDTNKNVIFNSLREFALNMKINQTNIEFLKMELRSLKYKVFKRL